MYMLAFQYIYTGNGTNGNGQFPPVWCERKTETANFRLCTANFRLCSANGKRKFVSLHRQTINGNRRLLFQHTCPSMPKTNCLTNNNPQVKVKNISFHTCQPVEMSVDFPSLLIDLEIIK